MFDGLEDWQSEQLVEGIEGGAVIIFPTDTVYGIGCTINSSSGIDRVYRIKGRSEDKPFPVLATKKQAAEIASFSSRERRAIKQFWPGNLTLVLRTEEKIDNRLVKQGKIALRVPDLTPLLKLLEASGPLVGTSANISGDPAPRRLEAVAPLLLKEVDYVLGVSSGSGQPSTVAGWNGKESSWEVFREGEIGTEELP